MSTQIEINQRVVNYLSKIGYRSDPVVNELVKATQTLSTTAQMQIAPEQGQFLEIVVKLIKAKNCLEIGRFTGLSTLCMAKGLPSDGIVLTIDNSIEFQDLAKKYWAKAGVKHKIESIIGEEQFYLWFSPGGELERFTTIGDVIWINDEEIHIEGLYSLLTKINQKLFFILERKHL